MPTERIKELSSEAAVNRVVDSLKYAPPGTAPFAIVLGAGFSYGLVPTTRQIVNSAIPLWLQAHVEHVAYAEVLARPEGVRDGYVRSFWTKFVSDNGAGVVGFQLDAATGRPDDIPAAYKAAFAVEHSGALGKPVQARRFQRDIVATHNPRLNAAHFLLASILAAQPNHRGESQFFKTKAAFSRLILTTNFDPFLQVALQIAGRLYFMSDTTAVGVTDEVLDDESDAVHLVYLHGSIHRRAQASTEEEIQRIKQGNARILMPVLRRRGVIVIGYSGWDDAIVHALDECPDFDHCLYWCGRDRDPLSNGFGKRVPDILRKPTSFYVPIESAGHFMTHLTGRLIRGLPRMFSNPVGQVREMLEAVDLKEIESIEKPLTQHTRDDTLLGPVLPTEVIMSAQRSAIEVLKKVENEFFGPNLAPVASQREHLYSCASVAYTLQKYEKALFFASEGYALAPPQSEFQARCMDIQANALYSLNRPHEAIHTWTKFIEHPKAAPESVCVAFLNRALAYGQLGESGLEIADYTYLIEQHPGVPDAVLAKALFNRAHAWRLRGNFDREVEDYTHIIDNLADAPAREKVRALISRGFRHSEHERLADAFLDFTRAINDFSDAGIDQIARALVNRGIVLARQDRLADSLVDFNHVIDTLKNVPSEIVADAYANRGWVYYKLLDYARFLSDTEAALRLQPSIDHAQFNLGLALLANGRDTEARDAYLRAKLAFPDHIEDLGLRDLQEAQTIWLAGHRAHGILNALALKAQ